MRRRKEIYITQPVLRNNRNLFRKKHLFERKREDTLKGPEGKLVFKKASAEKLRSIRKKISGEHRSFQILEVTLVLVTFLILLATGYTFYINEKEQQIKLKEKEKIAYIKKNMPEYEFYIDDGNRWLRKGHYKNARYQFKKALELFPNDQLAKEKLNIVNLKSKCK